MRRTSSTRSRVNYKHWTLLTAAVIALGGCGGCKGKETGDSEAETNKKALQAVTTELKEPVALIAAYLPYMRDAEPKDKFTPKRRNDAERVFLHAANEIRFAANRARLNLERSEAPAVAGVLTALRAVTASCADLQDPSGLPKCSELVDSLDAELGKVEPAAAAAGVTGKIPRITPEAVTDAAKTSIAPFLRAKGPGPAEKAYIAKRSEDGASADDLINACQSAADETGSTYSAFEKAEEPLRIIAVTHKMAVESQCNTHKDTDFVHREVIECGKDKKKRKSPECKLACGKAKARIEDGLPAAAFAPLETDYTEACEEDDKKK